MLHFQLYDEEAASATSAAKSCRRRRHITLRHYAAAFLFFPPLSQMIFRYAAASFAVYAAPWLFRLRADAMLSDSCLPLLFSAAASHAIFAAMPLPVFIIHMPPWFRCIFRWLSFHLFFFAAIFALFFRCRWLPSPPPVCHRFSFLQPPPFAAPPLLCLPGHTLMPPFAAGYVCRRFFSARLMPGAVFFFEFYCQAVC
jgi:hypothetical protein